MNTNKDGAAPAAEPQLVPKWAGQFDSHQDWVNRAQRVLSVPSHKPNAICVDAKGRRCHIGADMARARDEDAFPVRYFWECTLAAAPSAPTLDQAKAVPDEQQARARRAATPTYASAEEVREGAGK